MHLSLIDLRDHLTTLIETGVADPHAKAYVSQNGRLHPITVIDPVKRPVNDVFPAVGIAFGGK